MSLTKKSVDGDLNFSANGGGVRRIRFAGVSDSGWLLYHAHDSTANNPWNDTASTQNSVLELGVGSDVGIHADSVGIEGCAGIYLKVTDRVISSAKIEARGGVAATRWGTPSRRRARYRADLSTWAR